MKLKTIACLALLALCTSTPVNAASVAAYAAGPAVNNVRLSPDGKMVAFSTHKGDEPHVIVQTLDDRKLVADVELPGVDINDVRWAGSKQLLVMTVQDDEISGITDGNHVMVQSIDLASRKATDLLRDQQSVINVLQGPPVVRVSAEGVAKALLIAPNMVGSFALSLYETDLSNGRSKLLGRGDSDVRDWQVGRDGNALAQIKYDRETRRWQVAEKRGLGWKSIATGVGLQPKFVGLTADGAAPILNFRDEFGFALRSVAADGSIKDVLPGDQYAGLMADPTSQRVYGAWRNRGDVKEYQFIDHDDEVRWTAISKGFAGARVDWVTESEDRRRLVVMVTPKGEPPYYALVDLGTGKARDIGDLYAGVTIADTAPVSRIEFAGAGDLKLDAYLATPRNRPAKGLPLIVLPPDTYFSWATGQYDSFQQVLASRGYAVLRVNYRGLPGAGRLSAGAGAGELGDKSLDDLAAAVRQLAKDGVVDPSRVCIWGTNYLGGYSALAAIARDPAVYRCAVADSGFLDLREWTNLMYARDRQEWLARFGVKQWSDPKLVAISPLYETEKMKIPVLLLTDSRDTSRLAGQTRLMEKALRRTNGNVQTVARRGDNSARSTPSAQVRWVEAVVTFLEKNNPPN